MSGSLLILIFMMGLVLLPFLKRHQAREVPEHVWLWAGGLAFPMVVLTALLAWGLPSGQSMLAGGEDGVHTVRADAFQWGWDFAYPDSPAVTRNVLYIPAGEPVDVEIRSADVIHAFWVPRLAGKTDAIPGTVNTLRIIAPEPGIYEGMCAEFCGLDHTTMRFQVIAHAPAEYEARRAAGLDGEATP